MKYSADAKLICKHSLLLNGKNESYDPKSVIKENLNIFKNISSQKNIVIATIEGINIFTYMENLYNENSQIYDYISSYENEFKDINDNNFILTKLFSNAHKELNTLSYFNMINNKKNFTEEEENNIKFIISILKSIFIRRYIVKRNNIEYSFI